MINEKEREIFGECFETWGDTSQFMMLIEECSELIKSCAKDMYRNMPEQSLKNRLHNFAEELADVQLMIDEFIWRFQLEEDVRIIRVDKLDRLKAIIKSYTVSKEEKKK